MLIEQILGNIHTIDSTNLEIDKVQIEWYDTGKKIALLQSQNGKTIAMRLTKLPKYGLKDGDILFRDTHRAIVISILPTWVLSMWLKDWEGVARLCYEIGNLHIPLFFGKNKMELQTPFEKPLQRVLERLCIPFKKEFCILDSKDRLHIANAILKEPELMRSPNMQININKKD